MPVFGVDNNETDKDGHMILEIPKNAEIVLHTLENAGYEAYVVGGCVRDSGGSRMTGISQPLRNRSR